jgi:SNF2 family DNA or RNA helicase
MIFEPRPWQPPMMAHLAEHKRCALFAAMGSGKCAAVLHGLKALDVMEQAPGLVIAPKRVAKETWPNEVERWDSLASVGISPIVGTQTERFMALKRDTMWYSINYEQIPWLVDHLGKKNWPFRTIVADESTRLKGARSMGKGGQRTNALAKVAWLPQVERFIELTGTPAPNGLKDLWGQMMYLDGGARLGSSFTAFKERWFGRPYNGYGIEPFPFTQEQIQEKIRDICLTIDPRDYVDISEPIESEIVIELPPKVMDIYREMEKKMFVELEHDFATHEIEAVHSAARTNKCLQIAAGFVYNEDRQAIELHDAKLEALDSVREEANGMPLLISYIFKHDLTMLKRKFPKLKSIDETTEKEWNAGHVPMLAAHPASAGHGLNLQYGSNILVDYSSGWDLEYDQQIGERIGPMRQFQAGLNRPVYRYRIMAHRTADFLVKQRRTSKRSVQDILLEAMKRKEEGLCPVPVN